VLQPRARRSSFRQLQLAGYVAAEANHAKVKKLEKELRSLYSRIVDVLESYTDEPDKSGH